MVEKLALLGGQHGGWGRSRVVLVLHAQRFWPCGGACCFPSLRAAYSWGVCVFPNQPFIGVVLQVGGALVPGTGQVRLYSKVRVALPDAPIPR